MKNTQEPSEGLDTLLKQAAQHFTFQKEENKPKHTLKAVSKPKSSLIRSIEKLQILYVEDDPNDQLILKRSLDKNLRIDFDLEIAGTGIKGLEKLEEKRYDLVLLDYKLPSMTGLEFLDEMRKRRFKVEVILITGQGSEKIAVDAIKRGVRDYVTKDEIVSEQFAETIRNLVLESALLKELNAETAKQIVELYSKSKTLRSKVFKELNVKADSILSLKELVNTILKLAKTRSAIACPACSSTTSTPYLQCTECGSLQILKEGTLEHITCGCIDFMHKFDRGESELVCPNCNKRLKQVGVDYRRLESWFRCSNGHLLDNPILIFRCPKCNEDFTIDAANLKKLYWYQI